METIVLVASNYWVSNIHYLSPCPHSYHYQGLEPPPQEVLNLISHATQERLKTMVSKLSIIAEHRLDVIKTEGNYDVTQDIKQQLRFLEDLDKMEKKRHEEAERELLLRAAKSR